MKKLKEKLLEALGEAGFSAQTASPWRMGELLTQEKICLGIHTAEAAAIAAASYLGRNVDGDETYGLELKLSLSLRVLTPKENGLEGCEEFAETVMERLIAGIDGFPAEKITLGAAEYDGVRDCFSAELITQGTVAAIAEKSEDALRIQDFIVVGKVVSAW